MKAIVAVGTVLLAVTTGEVLADCSAATQVIHPPGPNQPNALQALLRGQTICAIRGSERWQEDHRAAGALWDYKKGPNDKVDPSKQVGTWDVTGRGTNTIVTYNYGEPPTYSFTVHQNSDGTYSFCNTQTGEDVIGKLQDGRRCP